MNWFSSIIVGILLIHTSSFVLSQRGFGPEEIKFEPTASLKHEMKIRELSNRLGIKYGELLARSRKNRRNMREINSPNVRAKFEIPERKLIDKFIVSQGRSTLISHQKKTIVPKKEKSSKKFKLNFEKLSKMFKLSSSSKKNKGKDINNSNFNKTKKSTIEKFQSGKKSFTREMPETQKKTKQVSKKRPTKRQTFRLNIFKKSGMNNSSNRRKIKINVSMFSRLAERSRGNKKQNLPGKKLQKPEIIPRIPNRSTETAINKHITPTRAEKLNSNHDLLDRKTQKPKPKFKSGFKRPKTRNILIPVKHKTQKNRLALSNKSKQAPKIKLRSRFEKPEKSVVSTRTSRITQAPKSRFNVPDRKKQGPKIKSRSRFEKPERRDFLAPDVRKTQIPKNRHDIPDRRIQTPKIKLRNRFQQQERRNGVRQTPTSKTKTPISKLDLPELRMQVSKTKLRSRFEKPDRHDVSIPPVRKTQTPKSRLDPPNEGIKPPKIKLRGRFNIPERRDFSTPDIQKTQTAKNRENLTDRRIQAPQIKHRSRFNKPERRDFSTPTTVQKTQTRNSRHNLPDRRIQAPKIKLRSRFEKPGSHDVSTPTVRNTQTPKNRLDLPDKRIQHHPKINLRSRFHKPERPESHFLTPNVRKTQTPKSRPDKPDERIKKPKIKLRSRFEKPDRRDFWVPPVRNTQTTKNKLHLPDDRIQDIRRINKFEQRQNTNVFIPPKRPIPTSTQKRIHDHQAQNDIVRNKFEKPPRQSLRQFINTIKIKNENNIRPVFITRAPTRHYTTSTTVNPTTKTKVTTRRLPSTTSSTTLTTPETTISTTISTTSTTTTMPPTTTLPPTTTTSPPTTTTLAPTTTTSPPTTTTLPVTTTTSPPTTTTVSTEEKVSETLSGESNVIINLQKGPKRMRLDFSSFPTSSSRTASIINHQNVQPTEQTRLRLDFSSFPTASTTSIESRSSTTNEINAQVLSTEEVSTSTIRLNIPGSQGSGESVGTLASPRTGTTLPSTTSSLASQKTKVKEPVQPTGQTGATKIRFSLPSLPPTTSINSIDSSTSNPSGTEATPQSELGNIESEILNQLRQTPEFVRASQENTPEADMKLKEVLDGLLINLTPNLENPFTTTHPDNSGGQTMVSDTDKMPAVREVDLTDPLPTESNHNRAILIPKRFSQPTPSSRGDITDSGAGESDWMFIQSELNKLFPG